MEVKLRVKVGWHSAIYKVNIEYDIEYRVWEGKIYSAKDSWDVDAAYGFNSTPLEEVFVAEDIFDLLFIILDFLHEEV